MNQSFKFVLGAVLAVLLGFFAFKTFTAETETSQLIPRKLLFGNPEKARPRLSPDGKQLAFLAPDKNNVLNVYVRPVDSKNSEKKVTQDPKRGVRQFFWQYDNQHIIYIQDTEGDENWHLFQTNVATGETKDLTPFPGVRVNLLEYIHTHPDTLLVEMNQRDPALFDVYRLDLTTGGLTLDTENPDNVNSYIADHDLNVRVVQSYTPEGDTLIRIRNSKEEPWKELLRWSSEQGEASVVSFSPDNQSIYLISNLNNDTSQLIERNLKTGKQKVLAEDPEYDISSILVHPKTFALQAVAVQKDKLNWLTLDPSLKKDFAKLKELGDVFTISNGTLDDKKWIVASVSDVRPTHFYLYDRKTQGAEFLFSTLPALEKYPMSPMEPVQFKARDGLNLHGYLVLPRDEKPKNLPTILYVHGGPWVRETWGFDPMAQWFANRGYAVLQLNYRGSTGYGKAFLHAGDKEWGGKMQDDLLDAKEWLVQQGYSDPNKVLIYGGSYGGYAVLAALAFTPEAFCCGIDIVGPSSLLTLIESIPPYWKPARSVFDRRVGNYDTEKEFLKERSPLFKSHQINKPLMIAHGANDPRVKKSESDQLVEAIRGKGKDVQYLLFEDEGHGFARPQNRLRFYAAAEEFLKRHLGGKAQAPDSDENWEAFER